MQELFALAHRKSPFNHALPFEQLQKVGAAEFTTEVVDLLDVLDAHQICKYRNFPGIIEQLKRRNNSPMHIVVTASPMPR